MTSVKKPDLWSTLNAVRRYLWLARSAASTTPGASRQGATRALAFALGVTMAGIARGQEIPQPRLPTVEVFAGMHRLSAEVARTPHQRQIGMMMRPSMAAHEAMLFVFDEPSVQCFWMKNTLVPLSAAFVEDDGRIVNIADMQPLSERSHCRERPVRHVLEVNQGWFAKRGIGPGFKLRGSAFVSCSR